MSGEGLAESPPSAIRGEFVVPVKATTCAAWLQSFCTVFLALYDAGAAKGVPHQRYVMAAAPFSAARRPVADTIVHNRFWHENAWL
jgi:hypothetical protein